MKPILCAFTIALAWPSAACDSGSSGTPDADPNVPDADPNAPDADPNAPDADPSAPDGGTAPDAPPPPPPTPACYATCATVADCDFGNPINDADNYECDEGVCRYTGCNSTQECVDTFMSTAYACGTVPGIVLPSCLKTCSGAADCATVSPAYDADNYQCTGGLCEYIGCHGDQECTDSFGGGYGCHEPGGFPFAVCVPQCGTPADCVFAPGSLYDVDNYACESGYCQWIGCNATSECVDAFMDPGYLCR
jgi:hypothetical protein